MRQNQILVYLADANGIVSLQDLMQFCQVSERTIRSEITSLNELGKSNGFQIKRIRKQGYQLIIEQLELFLEHYNKELSTFDVNNPEQRMLYLQLLLFQKNSYLTIDEIAGLIDVSRSTVQQDLKKIDAALSAFNLKLERKAHYGIRIVGAESLQRKMILKLLSQGQRQLSQTDAYQHFAEIVHVDHLTAFMQERINHYHIQISDIALENMIEHIRILSFRVSRKNFIKSMEKNQQTREDPSYAIYQQLSQDIIHYLIREYQLEIPQIEIEYLTEHLIGKASVDILSDAEKAQLHQKIREVLVQLDLRFDTFFSQDEELQQALLMHIYPLILRVHQRMQLDNPIIEDIYTRYAHVFNMGICFIQLFNLEDERQISKDEIGYIAIYFAASMEKERNRRFRQYRKIAVLCSSGGGAAYLVKMKLESMFTNAKIEAFSMHEKHKILVGDFDTVISTIAIDHSEFSIPVIETSPFLDEHELKKIKDGLSLLEHSTVTKEPHMKQVIDYFSPDCFLIETGNRDYLTIVEGAATELVKKGYAQSSYPKDVLERELRMSTVYQNGVAGPHPIEMGAIQECIQVIILKQPQLYLNRKVELIFMINLNKGHVLIHQEISKLMMKIMEDDQLLRKIVNSNDYGTFIEAIKTIV